jgi:hypothetical protein
MEALPPQSIAQQRLPLAARMVLLRRKDAPQRWRDPKRREKSPRHAQSLQQRRFARAGQVETAALERPKILVGLRLLLHRVELDRPPGKLIVPSNTDPGRRLVPWHDNLSRLRIRQRLQQNRIDQAEDRRRRPNPQAKQGNGRVGKSRRLPQQANAEAYIFEESGGHASPDRLVTLLLEPLS